MTKYNDEFETYLEKFERRLGKEYYLDDLSKVRPKPGTKVIEFGQLWDTLRSNDKSLLEQNKWMFDEECRFLDPDSATNVQAMRQVVSYSSYPRCGNSFLRKYL